MKTESFFFGLMMLGCSCAMAQRSVSSINDSWSFKFPDQSEWTSISLPHTYNLDAYSVLNYYKGKGEYSRKLYLDALDPGRRYFLKFDAANKAASVTVNGHKVTDHVGGYAAFCTDVTKWLKQGENLIEVTVNNSRRDIPPLSADFTFFGGLYRDAWLISTPDCHFDITTNGASGVKVTPLNVSENSASLDVKSRIVNDSKSAERLSLNIALTDPQGKPVADKQMKMKLKPGEFTSVDVAFKDIKNPKLWSPDSPDLYSVKVTLADASGKTLDVTEAPVGFRWFEFTGKDGFKLNGKHLKLRGVNRHQDLAPVGVALDDAAHRRDLELIKDLGANFVRLAHYQQDDAVLEACDRLGLIVWEEIPVVNMVPDEKGFDDNCEVSLVEMINQHYNHPSVMMWGFMNEILLHAPSDTSSEWPAAKERILNLGQRLERKLKEEDPTRASVMAFHGSDRYNSVGLDLTDVQGWNLYQGWYGADLTDFEKYLEDQRKRYPERSLIISEWGAGSDRRLHSARPQAFDFSMEYQQKYIEHYLPYIEQNDYISGASYWNFIDFNVGERQESMPRTNNKGLFYNDRTPKDVAYYFKSMWRNDAPVIRIATRDIPVVVSDDPSTPVKVYSNCPEVELFVNGKSQGRKATDNCFALFNLQLPEGESSLVAKGVFDGKSGEDATTITRRALPNIANGETLAINLGSYCDFTSAVNGLTWLPDQPYEQGKWGYTDGKRRSSTSEIYGTHDTPLYQTMLENLSEYLIDVPAGRYDIELLFTDINRKGSNSPYLLGRDAATGIDDKASSMTITIDGQTVDADFSPSARSGYQHAVARRYRVDHTADGPLRIGLAPKEGKTFLSGVSLRRL